MEDAAGHGIYASYLWSEHFTCHSPGMYKDTIKLTASINVWMSNFQSQIAMLGKKYG